MNALVVLIAVILAGLYYGMAAAQTYPARPVRFIVAFAPGGAQDIVGRIIAAQLTVQLGQQVVVDNRAGAGSVIGTEIAAKAIPDGYTLLLLSAAQAISPSLYKMPYDPVNDFTPVARIGSGVSALVVHPSVPVNSVKDLIALAKDKPGNLNFGAAGVGSFTHLSSELFRMLAGIEIVIVQYKGAGPAVLDLIGGHTQASIGALLNYLSHIHTGKLKLLGIGGSKRSVVLPDVPTIAEAGVGGYEASSWFGIAAPAGTPKAIVDGLNRELSVILTTAEAKKRLLDQGAEIGHMGPAEFGSYFVEEMAKWARVIKAGNIKSR